MMNEKRPIQFGVRNLILSCSVFFLTGCGFIQSWVSFVGSKSKSSSGVAVTAPTVVLLGMDWNSSTGTSQSPVKLAFFGDSNSVRWCTLEQSISSPEPPTPSIDDSCWVSTRPTTQDLGAAGTRIVYVFVQDANGNISPTPATASIDFVPAYQLIFSTQPSNTVAGGTLNDIVVSVANFAGQVINTGPDLNASITLSLFSGESINGSLTATALGGVARFSGLSITAIGTQNLVATKTSLSNLSGGSGELGANSIWFSVGAAATPSSLVVTGFSTPATAGIAGSVTVTAYDQYSNVATGYNGTVSLSSSNSSATLPISHTFSSSDAGRYTFSPVILNQEGAGFSITASDGSLSGSETGIAVNAATASQINLTGALPSTSALAGVSLSAQPSVVVQDSYGNIVSSSTIAISIAAFSDASCTQSGIGTLGANTNPLVVASGVASFSGVSYTLAGNFYLGFSAQGFTPICFGPISVGANAVTQVVLTGPSIINSGSCPGPYTLNLEDQYGNLSTLATNETVAISATGSGTLYKTTGCINASATPRTITAGSSTKQFYYQDSIVENPVITISPTGYSASNFNVTVKDTMPNLVLGQPNFFTDANRELGMQQPSHIATDGTRLILADSGDGRVLIWNTLPISNQVAPNLVLGAPSLDAPNNTLSGGQSMANPTGVTTDGTHVIVSDTNANRVLIWTTFPTVNQQSANLVIGQTNLTTYSANQGGTPSLSTASEPNGVSTDGMHIALADTGNNRVLLWNAIPTGNGVAANLVLGQSSGSGVLANQGGSVSQYTLNAPKEVYIYNNGLGTIKLFVSDTGNNRVLIWNEWPTSNDQAADLVIGQSSMSGSSSALTQTGLNQPAGIYYDGSSVYVGDTNNNRVLIWSPIPTINGAAASLVEGPSSFTGNYSYGAAAFGAVFGIAGAGSTIFLSDSGSNRVQIVTSGYSSSGQNGNYVLGQPSETSSEAPTQNVVSGASLDLFSSNIWSNGSVLLAADGNNNRILIWNSLPSSNQTSADLVLGQTNMTNALPQGPTASGLYRPLDVTSNGTQVAVADAPGRILIWTSFPTSNNQAANLVLGVPDMTTGWDCNGGGPSAQTVCYPQGVTINGTKLLVADTGNSRILIWNTLPTTSQQAADLVLGQPNFSEILSNQGGSATNSTMSNPVKAYFDGTRLFVADTNNNRILIWKSFPTQNGQAADFVLGGTSGYNVNYLYGPNSVYSDGTHLYVGDFLSRILIWNSIPNASTLTWDRTLGQTTINGAGANLGGQTLVGNGFWGAPAVIGDGTRFYVADPFNQRILIWNNSP